LDDEVESLTDKAQTHPFPSEPVPSDTSDDDVESLTDTAQIQSSLSETVPSETSGAEVESLTDTAQAQPSDREPNQTEPAPVIPSYEVMTKPSYAEKPVVRTVDHEEVAAAPFEGTAQKLLFTQALSDFSCRDIVGRMRAAKILGGIPKTLSVRVVAAQFLRESSPQVRKECALALAALGMKDGLPVLEYALCDESAPVRLAAVAGIYRLAGVNGISELTRTLCDQDAEVRRFTVTCLGWLGQEHLAAKVARLFADEAASVRQAAIEAVGNLQSRRVIPLLIECIGDSNDSVREKAADVLVLLSGKRMPRGPLNDRQERMQLMAHWRYWWRGHLWTDPFDLKEEYANTQGWDANDYGRRPEWACREDQIRV
jgi:hypothetical protein